MSIKVRLQQSKFGEADGGGKWHARVVSQGVVTTPELADSIQENTSFTRGDVRGIVIALIDEIAYRLGEGQTVALEGLGRFHLTVESTPVVNKEDFKLRKNIKSIKCKFVPAGRRDPMTGKKEQDFASGVTVEWADEDDDD